MSDELTELLHSGYLLIPQMCAYIIQDISSLNIDSIPLV